MKITYIRLENLAGIKVGMNRDILEIDLTKSQNRLVAIQAANGSGKTVLLSSLTPFSSVTSMDERSTLHYIIPGKDGYKEIHYEINGDKFIIKHYYKSTRDTHSVKSYFSKNGVELNENGNVSSFNSLVEIHFGLTPDMMRLIRIGSNVSSFINLTPAKRKEYIGKLITEINVYLQMYKKISEDLRVAKTLLHVNLAALKKMDITDLKHEEKELKKMNKELEELEQQRATVQAHITELENMISSNDLQSLRNTRRETQKTLEKFAALENQLKQAGLDSANMPELTKEKDDLVQKEIDTNSQIIGIRIAIDDFSRNISRLEARVAQFSSNTIMNDIISKANALRDSISNTPDSIKSFASNTNSEKLSIILSKLAAFNQIAVNLYQISAEAIKIFCSLYEKKTPIDRWLIEKAKSSASEYDRETLRKMFRRLSKNDLLLEAPCQEYNDCPYYRLASIVSELKDELYENSISEETIRGVQIISTTLDNILNEYDELGIREILPKGIYCEWGESEVISHLKLHTQLFPLEKLSDYLNRVKASELYKDQLSRLQGYESQILAYKNSGIESQLAEIQTLREKIISLKDKMKFMQSQLSEIQSRKVSVESKLNLITNYESDRRYIDVVRKNLESAEKLIIPLETASDEKSKEQYHLFRINSDIDRLKLKIKGQEQRISEYQRLISEANKLQKTNDELSMILEAVSTKTGIPVYYMKRYLGKIHKLSNDLLNIIYHGSFMLDNFRVTTDTFEIPYIKNGKRIPDIKYGSQSEVVLSTMAFSFALADSSVSKYNIPLLDEVDSGLDDENRFSLLKMLNNWIDRLDCEQVFFISHNLSQVSNIPMDCIRLSEVDSTSDLQNVIFQ